jgi:chromosome partitioning protein
MSVCKRVVIANSKGGVGKTTTVLECAAYARMVNKKVLVVDMDPQADATKMLLNGPLDMNEKHIFHLLIGTASLVEVVRKSSSNWNDIHIIPSDLALTRLPEHISGTIGYEKILAKYLDQISHLYDLIIIDTGPQTTVLTQLALRAADSLLIPTDTSIYSESAIERTLSIKNQLETECNHKIELIGVIFSAHHKPNARVNKMVEGVIFEKYGNNILNIILPHCTKVLEAQRGSDETEGDMMTIPTLSIIKKDHPLFLNFKKITETMLGG